ncbi:MAG: AIR carboxylase family protein [Verrucomicrobiales bacterium]
MKVIMIYGSENDKGYMQPARDYLEEVSLAYEEVVLSAHRNLPELIDYLDALESSGEKAVILAIAGLSAALPGVVAVKTERPCIGVPVPGGPLNGVDALLAIVQVPGQVPVTSVGSTKGPAQCRDVCPPHPEAGITLIAGRGNTRWALPPVERSGQSRILCLPSVSPTDLGHSTMSRRPAMAVVVFHSPIHPSPGERGLANVSHPRATGGQNQPQHQGGVEERRCQDQTVGRGPQGDWDG